MIDKTVPGYDLVLREDGEWEMADRHGNMMYEREERAPMALVSPAYPVNDDPEEQVTMYGGVRVHIIRTGSNSGWIPVDHLPAG